MFGKKIYKTSMLNFFRLIVLAIVIFFFNDYYLETISDDRFLKMVHVGSTGRRILDFFEFNITYPADFISFFCIVLVPAFYFAFIRGVRFHEKGFYFNRGIPFFNQTIKYEELKTYKLLHPNLAISIHTKSGDAYVIADNTVERVIAILDQHDIPGDLAQDDYVRLINNYKKFIIFVVSFIVLLFIVRKLGPYFFSL